LLMRPITIRIADTTAIRVKNGWALTRGGIGFLLRSLRRTRAGTCCSGHEH
jgi:hypothetical protein